MSTNANPTASVIIPVYDDYERLQSCLEALDEQTYPAHAHEVIVADNGTPPERRIDMAERFDNVRMTVETKTGSYAARNAGLEVAAGEILAFTDADCLPEAQWLEEGVRTLEETENCGMVGGPISLFPEDATHPTLAETWELERGFPQRSYVEELNFSATANMFTTRDVIDDVGSFDDDLKSGGDREFGERVAAAGYRQLYAPEARVRHPARRAMRDLLKKTVRTTRGDYRRREKKGEFSPPTRLLRLLRAAGDVAISPLRLGWLIATEGKPVDEAVKFALADTLVSSTRELVAIEQLGTHLPDRNET